MSLIEIPQGRQQIWNYLFTTAPGIRFHLLQLLPQPSLGRDTVAC